MASMRAAKVATKPHARAEASTSYEHDFYAWSYEQARALRDRRSAVLDWENLAEEIESLGRSDRREVRSRLQVILVHLLKWKHQKKKRSPSWTRSISEQRDKLEMILADSATLRREVPDLIVKTFPSARRKASREMRFSPAETEQLPTTSPFSVQEILDDQFFPE
jgi:hypothetical protein